MQADEEIASWQTAQLEVVGGQFCRDCSTCCGVGATATDSIKFWGIASGKLRVIKVCATVVLLTLSL